MADKMLGNEAVDAMEDMPVANTEISMARGMRDDDPEAQARINQALKLRGMDYARMGIGALGAGAAAAQGTTNPLAAMIQGISAGMQIPAQIYKEKQDQLKTTIDATPFGEVVPEAKNPDSPYSILAGIPYGLASKAIQAIATEAVKSGYQMKAEKAKLEAEKGKGLVTAEMAPGMAKLYKEKTGKTIDPNILVGLPVDEIKNYAESGGVDMSKVFADESSLRKEFTAQIDKEQFVVSRDNYKNIVDSAKDGSGASDIKLLYSYIKMIDPGSVVREGEVSLTQQGMSIPDRIITAYKNAIAGQKLSPEFRNELVGQAKDSWRNKTEQFKSTIDSYRTLAKNSGLDPNKVVTNIGNVLAYADPTDPRFRPITDTPVSAKVERKEGDVFSEVKDGWISTYKVVNVDGKLARKRISVVQDMEGK